MSKDDIIGGIIVGTILVVGGIVCVLGYQKMNEPIFKESNSKSSYTSNYSQGSSNTDKAVNTEAIADFAHTNVTPEHLIEVISENYNDMSKGEMTLRAEYVGVEPKRIYDSNWEWTELEGYEVKKYDLYADFPKNDAQELLAFYLFIEVDGQGFVNCCSVIANKDLSYDTQLPGIIVLAGRVVDSIAPETVKNSNYNKGGSIVHDAVKYGESEDKCVQVGDYIYTFNSKGLFFQAETKEHYINVWDNDAYVNSVVDLSDNYNGSDYTNDKPQIEKSMEESNNTEAVEEDTSNKANGDLFGYLAHPVDEIDKLLGEPKTMISERVYEDNITVREFNEKVNSITLLNGTQHSILGFKPGDSSEALEEMLKNKYEAKEYGRELGSDFRQYYFYINGEVRFVEYYFKKDGTIDTINCSYDELGMFEEPKDVRGVNPYTFTEDWDDLENLDLADQ